jgi:hypothetical protein
VASPGVAIQAIPKPLASTLLCAAGWLGAPRLSIVDADKTRLLDRQAGRCLWFYSTTGAGIAAAFPWHRRSLIRGARWLARENTEAFNRPERTQIEPHPALLADGQFTSLRM